jgi:hypothetical protein
MTLINGTYSKHIEFNEMLGVKKISDPSLVHKEKINNCP